MISQTCSSTLLSVTVARHRLFHSPGNVSEWMSKQGNAKKYSLPTYLNTAAAVISTVNVNDCALYIYVFNLSSCHGD